MNLDLSLELEESLSIERAKEAERRAQLKQYEPTWGEVWISGYDLPSGKRKPGIFQTKLTDLDRVRLMEVKTAIENGELPVGVDSLKYFTKTHAFRLYAQLQEKRKLKKIQALIRNKPDNYICVQSLDAFEKLIGDLLQETIVAVDTETTGLDILKDEIVGISFSLPIADYHVYIPVAHTTGQQLDREFVLEALRMVIENPNILKVLHNAKYDWHMFKRHGLELAGVHHDTRVAMAILNENEESYSLKNLATKYGKYFGFEDKSSTYEELFGNGGFQDTPIEIGHIYACKDTHLTWKLYQWQMEHFNRLPELYQVYKEIENELLAVCVHMEQNGFLVDMDFADQYEKELHKRMARIEEILKGYFGDVNLNSPAQLQTVLYDVLKLPDVSRKRSTDAKTLKALKDKHESIPLMLEYRENAKLLGTYFEALPKQVAHDGRLRGQFHQVATVTGRFSSSNPNLQNLPPEARKMFVAPEGKIIVGIDYSQIEPRVLAHMSGDKRLQEPYLNGQDLYSTLASRVFKVPIELCGDGSKYRKMMKVGLLAVMYGISTFSLAESLGITVGEAEQFIRDFYESYPEVYEFVVQSHLDAEIQEYVETLFHRKRRFPGQRIRAKQYKQLKREIEKRLGREFSNVWTEDLPYALKRKFWDIAKEFQAVCRQAVNARIQGTAADIMKMALIRVYKHCVKKGPDWLVLGTVHDEILFELPETVTREEIEELERIMTGVVSLDVPLKVDTAIMKRWGEEMSKDEWFSKKEVA